MGSAEISGQQITIYSHIITYGNAAGEAITNDIREEIETMWNEPAAPVKFHGEMYTVRFCITAEWIPLLTDIDIFQNTDPRNNYFRIEQYAHGNISFVDGLGCNTGYFLLENLYKGSTTATHEYGHTLGLDHPDDLDLRGKGVPGIMYPRGTLVDPQYQYEPDKPAGVKGGTMHPMYRRVLPDDIRRLKLHTLSYTDGKAIIGDFTSLWHEGHGEL